MTETSQSPLPPQRVHHWAVLTVCAVLALLLLGSLVTTLRAGMADKAWPTHPLHLAREDVVAEAEKQGYAPLLYIVEHSHRLAGYVVGCCSIVLCVWLWIVERRTWMKWLGTAALVGVCLQGVLGGMRVLLNDWLGTDLAALHGCFAQVVLAMLIAVAVFTSARWNESSPPSPRLRKITLLTASVIYVQIVFGAVLRHTDLGLGKRLHLLTAFAVVAVVLLLVNALRQEKADPAMRFFGRILLVVLHLQIVLGVEALMVRDAAGGIGQLQKMTLGNVILRTLHFVCGTLMFASALVLAFLARRPMKVLVQQQPTSRVGVLEGVA